MLRLYFLAALLILAKAELKCGEEIKTDVLEDYKQLHGNWTYVAQWDYIPDYDGEKYQIDYDVCVTFELLEASDEEIAANKVKCKGRTGDSFHYYPKYKFASSDVNGGIIALGSEMAVMDACDIAHGFEVRRVSEDYILLFNYELRKIVHMMSRKKPTREELECFDNDIDFVMELNMDMYCHE